MRKVKEWIGKTDDAKIPDSVKDRVVDAQGGVCALSGVKFVPGNRPQFDHKTPLWLGGKHCESNLQAITKDEHQKKTSAEATVRAKVNEQRKKHLGIVQPKGTIKSKGFPKPDKAPKQSTKKVPEWKRRFYVSAEQVRP